VGDGPSTWRPQLDGLSDEFTVVAWDAPGAGASSDPPESFGMAGYADCLAAFVAALGIGRPHVAGLSFGGSLALALGARHPGLARTLVLASAYAGWVGSLGEAAAQQRLQQALELAGLAPEELVAALLPTMFARAPSPAAVDAFRSALLAFHPVGLRAMARAVTVDLRDAARQVAVPTLLLYGDADVRAGPEVARALHAEVPGSTLTMLAGVGHVCSLEAPDDVNRALRDFVQAAEQAQPRDW
jgi:pimeloyl-ACP methyl ester carboxylesterase